MTIKQSNRLKLKTLLAAMLFSLPVFAQHLVKPTETGEVFRSGVELFQAEKYGSAMHQFEKVMANCSPQSAFYVESAYYIAVCHLESGNVNGRQELENFIAEYPQSAQMNGARFRLANSDFKLTRYKQALKGYESVDRYSLSPQERETFYFNAGYCYLETEDLSKAKNYFNELRGKPGPLSQASGYYRGHINYLEGNYDAALAEFDELENVPQYEPIIPYYKAQIAFIREEYSVVTTTAPSLFASAPNERKVELAKIIAVSYYRQQQYGEAIPYIDIYTKSNEVTPQEYYVAAFCYEKKGEANKAIIWYEKAVGGKDAVAQNAYYQLAGLYMKKGEKQRGMLAFRYASEMDFDPKIKEDAMFQYAKSTYELDYSPFNEAIKAFDRYISEYPDSQKNDQAYDYLVKVFMTTRNYKDALASLDKIKVKSPQIKKAYQRVALYRGMELFRDLNFKEAIAMFNKSLEFGQSDSQLKAQAYYWRGESLYRLGKPDEAIVDYRSFQSIPGANRTKEFATSNYNIGYILFNKDLTADAAPYFQKYLTAGKGKSPQMISDAWNRLGDCRFAERDFKGAVDAYENAYTAGNSEADYALFQKAFASGLLQEHQKKIGDLATLMSRFPQSPYGDDAKYETGRAYERLKDDNKAISSYKSLLTQYPESSLRPKALLQLGLIAYNRNNFDESIGYYKEVAEKYPDSPEAKGALTGIKNNYLESNNVDEYISYTKTLGKSATPTVSEQDSLTYQSAEKLFMAGDSKAKQQLEKYLGNFPEGGFALNARFYKAECEFKENNKAAALADYDWVLAQSENIFTENSLLRASELSYLTGDFNKALGYYERLAKFSGSNQNELIALAGQMRCQYELKNYQAVSALGWKIRSTEKIPQELDREATYKSAKALVELSDGAKAIPLWRKLSADTKSKEGAEAKYMMCQYYFDSNKLKEAENEVMNFIDKNTPHQYWLAKSFIVLAKTYEKQNDLFQATHTLKSVIENYEVKDDGILDEATAYLQQLENNSSAQSDKK